MSCDCDDWQEHAWQAARLDELEKKERQRRMAEVSKSIEAASPAAVKFGLLAVAVLVVAVALFDRD